MKKFSVSKVIKKEVCVNCGSDLEENLCEDFAIVMTVNKNTKENNVYYNCCQGCDSIFPKKENENIPVVIVDRDDSSEYFMFSLNNKDNFLSALREYYNAIYIHAKKREIQSDFYDTGAVDIAYLERDTIYKYLKDIETNSLTNIHFLITPQTDIALVNESPFCISMLVDNAQSSEGFNNNLMIDVLKDSGVCLLETEKEMYDHMIKITNDIYIG